MNHRIQNIYLRTKWLSLITASFPLLFAGLIIFVSFSLVYDDAKHWRVASSIENNFLQYALKIVGTLKTKSDYEIATISLNEDDRKAFDTNLSSGIKDANVTVYANVLEHLIKDSPKAIFLSWSPGARREPNAAYQDFILALESAKKKSIPVILAYPKGKAYTLPPEVEKLTVSVSDLNCQEPINLICPVVPSYEDWIGTLVYKYARPELNFSTPMEWISSELTLSFPAFILQLPKEESLLSYNFTDIVIHETPPGRFKNKLIFIGNSMIQDISIGEDPDLIRRVLVAQNKATDGIRTHGLPYHIFWALVSTQLRDGALIPIVPAPLRYSVLILFSLIILWFVLIHQTFRAFLFLTIGLILIFTSNLFAIKFLRSFMPIFDIIFVSISTMVLGVFLSLSIHILRNSRTKARRRFRDQTFDLKENFISMFSHNLNTPLAKLSSLLDFLLKKSPPNALSKSSLHNMLYKVFLMQHLVKLGLNINRLKDQGLHEETQTKRILSTEIETQFFPLLSYLGFDASFEKTDFTEEVSFKIDRKILQTLVFIEALDFHLGFTKQNRVKSEVTANFGRFTFSILREDARKNKQTDHNETEAYFLCMELKTEPSADSRPNQNYFESLSSSEKLAIKMGEELKKLCKQRLRIQMPEKDSFIRQFYLPLP